MSEMQRPEEGRADVRRGGEFRSGTHIGDRRLRISRRPETVTIPVPPPRKRRTAYNPAFVFVIGFGVAMLLGGVVLSLPVSQAEGRWTPYLDALFTSVSAVSMTGLVVYDTGTYWSPFGQVVIMVLIQFGGFGFMTSSTLLLMLIGHRSTLRERVLLRESFGGGGLGSVLHLARQVAIFVIIAELVGFAILSARFMQDMEVGQALWWGLFHSVSAFNNGGFDLVGGFRSLTVYQEDVAILMTISLLFVTGSLSYAVVADVVATRRWDRLHLDTKLVLATTATLLGAGAVAIGFAEAANPDTFGTMAPATFLLNAWFISAARTAGFSAIDVAAMTQDGLMILVGLMFIGGSAASTAGGIKVQTFSLLFFAIRAATRGSDQVEAFGRRVPTFQIYRALAVALLAIALVFLVTFLVNFAEGSNFINNLFEAVSALGTVGLSTGITPDLSPFTRVVLMLAMFTGRLGPLTLALALAAQQRRPLLRAPVETVRIG